MGAHAHHPAAAIGTGLAVFEEEVDAVPGPSVPAGAGSQPARAVLAGGELGEQLAELFQMRLPGCGHGSCSTTVPGG